MLQAIYVLLDAADRRVLAQLNLNIAQYAVIQLLDGDPGWHLTDLSERLLLDKSTVTRLIDRMEQAGFVQRVADPGDRRVQRVVLTADGQRCRDAVRIVHEEAVEHHFAQLDPHEQRCLSNLLAKVHACLEYESGLKRYA